ncbi:MAG: DUF1178 family protein [Pseudomonadota bacterium]
MIRYALICGECEHEFEAWFGSSDAYDQQNGRGLINCPACDGTAISKQIMAPAVSGTKRSAPPDPQKVFGKLAAKARQHISDNYDYVGGDFASEARAMYYGDSDHRPIWGETTSDEREALTDEGVPAEPLPPAFVPERKPDDKDIN